MTTNQDDLTTPGFRSQREPSVSGGPDVAAHGTRIADYVVRRVLGEGGMGIVYLADQIAPVERPVALKLIRAQLNDTMAAALFEVERRALARMDHPAIAKVYACGTTADGFPYLAMQWIDGPALNVFVRKQRPTQRERIALMAEVARGVAHAHARGILHRDLKPANILVATVDGRAEPKIIDFGIAIGIAGVGHEDRHGERAGTPGYMSPEQAGLSDAVVDARSDVYALGMMLLEILVPGDFGASSTTAPVLTRLHAALHTATPTERTAEAGERAHFDAAQALTRLRRDLRAVLRRATAPDPEQRYAGAAQFADDLARYLADEPVTAMPQDVLYLATRYMRRHRVALFATLSIVLALATGLTLSLRAQALAERERARAEAAAADAGREARRSKTIADLWRDVLTGIDPERARGLDQTLLKLVLDEAHARALHDNANDPMIVAEFESMIGATYFAVDDIDTARATLQRARARLQADASDAAELLRLHLDHKLAFIEVENGDRELALTQMRDVLARATQRFGAAHPQARHARAGIGWFQYLNGDFDASLQGLRAVNQELAASSEPDDVERADVLLRLGSVAIDSGEFTEGEQAARDSLRLFAQLRGDDHPSVLAARNSLAVALLRQHQFAEAAKELQELLPKSEAIYGHDHLQTLQVVNNLAGALRQSGQVAASGPLYQRGYEGFLAKNGEDAPMVLMTANNWALYLIDAGKLDEAQVLHLRTTELSGKVFADNPFIRSEVHFTMGKILAARGKPEAAIAEMALALQLRTGVIGADKPESVEIADSLAKLRSR